MKKIDYYTHLLYDISKLNMLVCPHKNCKRALTPKPPHSLCCGNGHSFDISSKGCVNFAVSSKSGIYDKTLFANRQKVFEYGFFNRLYDEIACIANQFPLKQTIADFGCGEGSGLRYLMNKSGFDLGIALDLSKEGIYHGAGGDINRILWFVADIANPPVSDASIDCVVNILSPASYTEFDRILKKGGVLIKAIPDSNYLSEIRSRLDNTAKKNYTNDSVYQIFKKRYPDMKEIRLQYDFPATPEFLSNLTYMTPLTKNVSSETIQSLLECNIKTITADFKILYIKM